MNRVIWLAVAQGFRRAALPLAWYYAVTLALPLANGAAEAGAAFAKHALVVLILPPVLIVLACAIHEMARVVARARAHLTNVVSTKTRKHETNAFFGEEVDFVIEAGRTLLPIEVKAAARPQVNDAKHLPAFREEYGRRCGPGLVLHTGDAIEWLAPGVMAAPWWKVL